MVPLLVKGVWCTSVIWLSCHGARQVYCREEYSVQLQFQSRWVAVWWDRSVWKNSTLLGNQFCQWSLQLTRIFTFRKNTKPLKTKALFEIKSETRLLRALILLYQSPRVLLRKQSQAADAGCNSESGSTRVLLSIVRKKQATIRSHYKFYNDTAFHLRVQLRCKKNLSATWKAMIK